MTPLEIAIWVTVGLAAVALLTMAWLLSARAHSSQSKERKKEYTIHLDGSKYFADIDEATVSSMVHEKLHAATDEAVAQFKASLVKTMPKIVDDVHAVHDKEVKEQLARYSQQFDELNQEVIDTFAQVHDDLMKRHAELAEGLDKRVVADYKLRMSAFDERLDDVVSGYVVESLGANVDLGAQLPYILGKIEENKEQIKKDMTL